ncbi:anoctamin-10-like isoform X1 [Argopecten irradians]|uniref:anoctamin-10-like isoform X1 n=2 Tax=Argopecten irradians TaxID=31199 RepID=UPI00371E6E7C
MTPLTEDGREGELEIITMETENGGSGYVDVIKKTDRPFIPLVIIEFTPGAKQAAIEWIVGKIQKSKSGGGADLDVNAVVMHHKRETVLYVGGSTQRLLWAADMMDIKKEYRDGYHREFSVEDVSNFRGSNDLDNFLTMSEKQKIILHELEAIKATEEDSTIAGYERVKLYSGNSIIKKYVSNGIISKMYPLHDEEEIKRLGAEWYQLKQFAKEQPIHHIREYFGEKIGMYFAFLGFYTVALIPPAFIGILYLVTSWKSMYREAIFAVFNLVWATIFLEAWKRYCSELSFKWGQAQDVELNRSQEPRAMYHGTMDKNPVTGKPEPHYPKYKRSLRFYGVTVPVIGFCLLVAFYIMLGYFYLQAWADEVYAKDQTWLNMSLLHMPTAIYAVIIGIVNNFYRKIAKILNDFENHRLQSSYDNHLIVKLILFDFVNCFMSLFYVAFYMQDMTLLRSHLAALLVTQQVIGQVREAMVPFIFVRRRKQQVDKVMKKEATIQKVEYFNGEIDQTVQKQVNLESTMDEYEGTMDDYLEMFLQFGYVFLFSSAFPLAAFWALLNNVTEIRSDAFKMCRVFQRPFAESASNIGAWQVAFEVISIIAVITNCALIGMDPEVKKLLPSDISAVNIVIVFVAVEHIILALKGAVAYCIPDTPKWVEIELEKMAFQTKQALHAERVAASSSQQQKLGEMIKMENRETSI